MNGERLPDLPELKIFRKREKRTRVVSMPTTETAIVPSLDMNDDESRPPSVPLNSRESFPIPTLKHPDVVAIQSVAPFAESSGKRRKCVTDDMKVLIYGTPTAKYLDLASKWITPCWWDVSHTVCRMYCMPAVELRQEKLCMIVRILFVRGVSHAVAREDLVFMYHCI